MFLVDFPKIAREFNCSYEYIISGTTESTIYRAHFSYKKEVTTHYSLIPNNKENNMDLKDQGQNTRLLH